MEEEPKTTYDANDLEPYKDYEVKAKGTRKEKVTKVKALEIAFNNVRQTLIRKFYDSDLLVKAGYHPRESFDGKFQYKVVPKEKTIYISVMCQCGEISSCSDFDQSFQTFVTHLKRGAHKDAITQQEKEKLKKDARSNKAENMKFFHDNGEKSFFIDQTTSHIICSACSTKNTHSVANLNSDPEIFKNDLNKHLEDDKHSENAKKNQRHLESFFSKTATNQKQNGDSNFCLNCIGLEHSGRRFANSFMHNLVQNSGKIATQKRYDELTKLFYTYLLLIGNRRVIDYVSANFNGPCVKSIKGWVSDYCNFKLGILAHNFEIVNNMYESISQTLKIRYRKVPYFIVEDKTKIKETLYYDSGTKSWIGSCGETQAHNCQPAYTPTIANYEDLAEAASTLKLAPELRAVIICPLDERYPCLPVVIHGICGNFDSQKMYKTWTREYELCCKHLNLGTPLGRATDGDTRYMSIMKAIIELVNRKSPDQKFYISELEKDFEIVARQTNDFQSLIISDINDQDWIHNMKKAANHLKNATRHMSFFGVPVHMNILKILQLECGEIETGLSNHVLQRKDPQNFKTVLPLIRKELLELLLKWSKNHIIFTGVYAFLDMLRKLYLIYAQNMPQIYRIYYCAHVIHFIKFWDQHSKNKNSTLPTETFQSIKIAMYAVINVIRYYHINCPSEELCMRRFGTQSVEDFFSALGNTIENHHTYSLFDACNNTRRYLLKKYLHYSHNFKGDLVFPAINSKRESDCSEEFKITEELPQLKSETKYPSDGEIAKAWVQAKDDVSKMFEKLKSITEASSYSLAPVILNQEDDNLEASLLEANCHFENEEKEEDIFFKLPNGRKIHKNTVSKLLFEDKISSDRIQRITQKTCEVLEKEYYKSKQYITIGNFVMLTNQEYVQILRIIDTTKPQDLEFISANDSSTKENKSIKLLIIGLKCGNTGKYCYDIDRLTRLIELSMVGKKISAHYTPDEIRLFDENHHNLPSKRSMQKIFELLEVHDRNDKRKSEFPFEAMDQQDLIDFKLTEEFSEFYEPKSKKLHSNPTFEINLMD